MESLFAIKGGFTGLAVSSRVRLARNLKEYPFQGLSRAQYEEIADKTFAVLEKTPALSGAFEKKTIGAGSPEAARLVETHRISPELARGGGFLIQSTDGNVSIMIGEEDHLRIQVIGQGLCPKECLETGKRIASLIENDLPFAYDKQLGYLTTCPTNVGTGLRASVMLHLPALTGNGGIPQVINFAGRAGCAVRGAYGEGSEATGGFYQISNQVTLGCSAEEFTEKLITTTTSVIEAEKKAREALRATQEPALKNRIYRALGVLQSAYLMSSKEATALISDLLVGLQMGYLTGVDSLALYDLEQTMNASLSSEDTATRDLERARIIRDAAEKIKLTKQQ